jgi:hypothetical protein
MSITPDGDKIRITWNGKTYRVPATGTYHTILQRGQRAVIDKRTLAYTITDLEYVRPPLDCPYLGDPVQRDGVAITVKCQCNGKKYEQLHTAHRCEVHHRCLPTLVPTDMAAWMARVPESELYHLCQGCLDRKPTPTATPTSPADRTAAS